MTTTVDLLNKLADLMAAQDVLRMDMDAKKVAIMAPVQAELNDLQTEYAPMFDHLQEEIAATEVVVRDAVMRGGESVKAAHLHAIFNKGRVTWDTKALDGYAVAHPELAGLRKVGEPSVAVRKV